MTACALVLHLGCRTSEASWIVVNKSVVENDYIVKHARHEFRATAPKEITKTKLDYFWLVPRDFNGYLDVLLHHTNTGFATWE